MTENPWQILSAGNVDAKRVDPGGSHDFFWVVSGKGEPGLLLRVAPGVEEPKHLPKMRSLDIGFRDIGGGRALLLVLKDTEQQELFRTLCLDVVQAAEAAQEPDEALQRAIRRVMRWHHLLRGGRTDLLKPNGKTITDYVLEIEKLYAGAEPEAYRLWELALGDTGFSFDDDYAARRWTIGKTVEFEVLGDFPRIAPPLRPGVGSVRYSVALDACAPFAIDPQALDAIIVEGVSGWTS